MECTLDMNARERLELPIGMIKRYISTHYHYHGMACPDTNKFYIPQHVQCLTCVCTTLKSKIKIDIPQQSYNKRIDDDNNYRTYWAYIGLGGSHLKKGSDEYDNDKSMNDYNKSAHNKDFIHYNFIHLITVSRKKKI